jgi:hypothetical protein
MIKLRLRQRAWLAAPAVLITAALGLSALAQAQSSAVTQRLTSLSTASLSAAVSSSFQGPDGHSPWTSGGKRWILHDLAAYDQAVKSKDWVYTPDGLAYKTCVHYVPNKSIIEKSDIILPSGVRRQIKPCTHPTLAYPTVLPSRPAQTVATSGPCEQGASDWWADTCWESPNWLGYFNESYAVPTNPAKDGALIFLFGGLQDSTGDTILQPVLTWGANSKTGVTNPNIWYITPWYVWPGGYAVGPNIHVGAGDTINGSLDASSCNGDGECTWGITVLDVNNDASSITIVTGGAMEVQRSSGCVETPANGHAAFRNLIVEDGQGVLLTPSFGVAYPDPQCSISEKYSSTGADILWKP